MRWSKALIPTTKETPSDAVIPSHQLMIRAGLIRGLGSGAYTYLPLGWRSLKKVVQIVREEMDAAGAQELLMPALHPKSLWEKTGRVEAMGKVLFGFNDRHGRETVLGPTHEEVVTELASAYLRSYKQLPVNLYQIQTKFRDEERPRFGVLRTREFIMMDAYSFDAAQEGLDASYQAMYDAYVRIMQRCGLNYVIVEAESGAMGGTGSQEFMIPTTSGEDHLARCACGYAANIDRCELSDPGGPRAPEGEFLPSKKIDTPGAHTVEEVTAMLKVKAKKLAKTMIYVSKGKPIAVMVRGDHDVNEAKLARLLSDPGLEMAGAETVERVTGCSVGFAGPVGLKEDVRLMADYGLSGIPKLVVGANEDDCHTVGVIIGRDFEPDEWADIRMAATGDPCPKCGQVMEIVPCIEVGHIFKLGTKYSEALAAGFIDEEGAEHPLIMGCYGIGVNRVLVGAIEDMHDENGIVWPVNIAPYEAVLVSVNPSNPEILTAAEKLYGELRDRGVDLLYDDRDVRPGVKFKDADLIGIPFRATIGERSLKAGGVELKWRAVEEAEIAPLDEAADRIVAALDEARKKMGASIA